MKKKANILSKKAKVPEGYSRVREEIISLLDVARSASVRSVNAVMTTAYWQIGRRMVDFEQGGKRRAGYGEELIQRLAADLEPRFGRGFGWRNLTQMRAFFLAWPSGDILQTPSAKLAEVGVPQVPFPLPWSAYVRLLSVKNPQARKFYEAEALRGGWSVRQLDRQVGSQFYERIALSRNKAAMLRKAETPEAADIITPEEAIKDPFILEFLNLKDEYSESDLEEALIRHLTDFLLELGDDFAFVGRQRRLRLDDSWFRVDLLFFHRRLKCLVIVDLKVGKFSYADAGQMHLYLNFAREHWMRPGENPPVGLILCAEKGAAEAHYALDNLPNKVLAAEYKTILPDEQVIANALRRSRLFLAEPPKRQRTSKTRSGANKEG
jgi:predicted nuclease of restriction endonuclease-like (RecB) superfamily